MEFLSSDTSKNLQINDCCRLHVDTYSSHIEKAEQVHKNELQSKEDKIFELEQFIIALKKYIDVGNVSDELKSHKSFSLIAGS